MAKKKNIPDSEIGPTGTAPAKARRARSRHNAVPAISVPEITAPAPVLELGVAAAEYAPEYEEIARLAYSYWEARGGEGGSQEEDWLRAEQELRTKRSVHADA